MLCSFTKVTVWYSNSSMSFSYQGPQQQPVWPRFTCTHSDVLLIHWCLRLLTQILRYSNILVFSSPYFPDCGNVSDTRCVHRRGFEYETAGNYEVQNWNRRHKVDKHLLLPGTRTVAAVSSIQSGPQICLDKYEGQFANVGWTGSPLWTLVYLLSLAGPLPNTTIFWW